MGIKLFDIKWTANTAGPSPYNNERSELFLFGCKKAMEGNPCKGCFNSNTWDNSVVEYTHEPEQMAEHLLKHMPNRYLTIGGGEPTDQIDDVIQLCKALKNKNSSIHILMYTWRSLDKILCGEYGDIMKYRFEELFPYIDIIVDGEYVADERLYDEDADDGTSNSVGSGNQVVWDIKDHNKNIFTRLIKGHTMHDIAQLVINKDDQKLIYLLKENKRPQVVLTV
jgi:organic radical activating enzyme